MRNLLEKLYWWLVMIETKIIIGKAVKQTMKKLEEEKWSDT